MKIRKRNGDLVDFEVDKIEIAISKAFEDTNTEATEDIKKIGKYIKRKIEKDDSLANVESIQDLVEVELQKRGYYQEAKEYILYRDKRNKHRTLMAKFDKIVNDKKILAIIDEIPKEFEEERYSLESFYQKVEAFTGKTNITEKEILDSLIKASSELTDKNSPDWEFIAARFLMYKLDKEIDRNEEKYGIVDFKTKIKFLEKDGRYGSYILENYSSEEIDELEDYINKDYDKLLTYSGLDLLIKRYIIKTKEDEPLERVQEMFMSIAMHLAMNEENKIGFAKDVYDILASLKATMATPTMSNARKPHHQLSSCFIDTVDDSLEGIFDSVSRFAKVSKFGGGMGMYMGKVRANGSDIRGYKGAAGGVIRWIRIINDTAVAVDQLGCVAKNSYVKILDDKQDKIVKIEDVRVDDLIKTFDPKTEEVVYKKVKELHDITVKHKDQVKIKYEDDSYIVTSAWHPTYNRQANQEKFKFVRADSVKVGDYGLSENKKESKVVEVDLDPKYDEDYKDLTVEDTNCYFVSTDEKFNEMYLIHNTRQGSVAVYLDLWHKDIPEFLGLRTNNGDDRMKAHDVFPAICVPDLFWRLCRDDINATWYMFDPHEVEQKYGKALEDTYGEEWENFYNTLVIDKNISKRTIQVKELVRLIIKSWTETGTPFVFNRDTVNKMNPNKHAGMIYSSNLCSEICQNMTPAKPINEKIVTTEDGDTVIVKTDTPGNFVECNLASLTLGNLDVNNKEELEYTINIIVRALDNVIDLNYYPTPYAEVTNKQYRAIGLGTSGYHHMLVKNGIRWSDKEEHLEFADKVYEDINYYTIKASMIIAKEKGPYELFEGSDWQTGDYFDLRNYNSDRWQQLKKDVNKYGIRNSYLMAIAPTGSTSIISGTSAGVDPIMSRYYLEEKKGSIVPRVAPGLDNRTFWLYENAHNVDQNITVEATGIRQRHIDQSQSVNIYITTDYTMRQILNIYINAWEHGVKSLYYVRGKSLEIEDCEVCSA